MMTPERMAAIKQQALKSIGARAKNPNAPGVSMIAVTPHEALSLVEMGGKLDKVRAILAEWNERRGTDNGEDGCHDQIAEAIKDEQ